MTQALVPLLVLILCAPSIAAQTPEARWGHVFVYDEARDEVLLFGGASTRHTYRADTWTWKSGVWTRHDAAGPSPRGFAAAAFDASRGAIVLHGGRGNERVTYSDTWLWNGSAWRQIAADGPWKADHHGLVWDRSRSMLVGFGGWTGTGVSGETWTFDNDGWHVLSSSGPPPRASFGMAWDDKTAKVVLYGGLWINGQYADTHEWDGRRWSAVTGPYDDSSLDHHVLVFDGTTGRLVLFGGKNYRREVSGRLRVLSGSRWVALPAEGPPPRYSTGMIFHPRRKSILLFGGKELRGEEQLPLGDFWEWDAQGWRRGKP
jgi:hypothetical protein